MMYVRLGSLLPSRIGAAHARGAAGEFTRPPRPQRCERPRVHAAPHRHPRTAVMPVGCRAANCYMRCAGHPSGASGKMSANLGLNARLRLHDMRAESWPYTLQALIDYDSCLTYQLK